MYRSFDEALDQARSAAIETMANQYTDRPQSTPEHIEERRLFVMQCRRKAFTWERCAEAVTAKYGYKITFAQCAEDFRIIMKARAKELAEETDSMRATMVDQLDSILTKALERAEEGSLDHMEIVIKLLARKSRLLGVDAPLRTETEDKTPALTNLSRAALLDRITAIQARLSAKMPAQLSEVTDLGEPPREVVEAELSEAPRELPHCATPECTRAQSCAPTSDSES